MNGSVIHLDSHTEQRLGVALLPTEATSGAAQRIGAVGATIIDSRISPERQGSARWEVLPESASVCCFWLTELTGQLALPWPEVPQRVRVETRRRQTELTWLERHAADLRALAGQWIAINGEELISHGRTAREVLEAARQRGVDRPLLFRVPSTQAEISFAAFD